MAKKQKKSGARKTSALPTKIYKYGAIPATDEYEEFYTWCVRKGVTDPLVQVVLSLEWWCRKDEHLVNWARRLDMRFMRHRKNVYKVWAKQLRAQYASITIEKWDKRKTAETPEAEDDTRTPHEERANALRQRVGISVFVAALKEAFGPDLTEVPSFKINTHFGCGGQPVQKITTSNTHVCSKCNQVYDQGRNSAQHLWQSEQFGAAPKAGGARKAKKAVNLAI